MTFVFYVLLNDCFLLYLDDDYYDYYYDYLIVSLGLFCKLSSFLIAVKIC